MRILITIILIWGNSYAQNKASKPNIIYINVDDFDVSIGGSHRGSLGNKGYTVPYNDFPNLKIASKGEKIRTKLNPEYDPNFKNEKKSKK